MALSITLSDSNSLSISSSRGINPSKRDESSSQSILKGKLSIATSNSTSTPEIENDATSIKIEGAAGADVAIEKRNIDEKQAAFDNIVELRQKQEELATLAANSASNSFTTALSNESRDIQNEITRVALDATDENGVNLFTGSTSKILSKGGGGGSGAAKSNSYDLAVSFKGSLTNQAAAVAYLDEIKDLDPIESSHRINIGFDANKVDTEIASASKEAEKQATQAQVDDSTVESVPVNVVAQLGISAYTQQQELASVLTNSLKVKSSDETQSTTIA